jgi:hydroxylamine reductase
MQNLMNCDQCEQTFRGSACVEMGVCGKDPDVESLQKTLLYSLKGMAAYAHHARRLGKTDPGVSAFIEEGLFATMTNVNFDIGAMLDLVLECGRMNYRVMQMLNDGHVERFGAPSPTTVFEGTHEGPGILVTGHDLLDLWNILEQAKGTDIRVYTHGEMLPAHMYPRLREHPNLAGHFGGAWQKQRYDFEEFSGPIVGTTNCVLIPRGQNTYLPRFFTTRATAVPGATRLTGDDFSAVIECARQCKPLPEKMTRHTNIGFHHSVILSLADKVIDAVKSGALKHVFVIGGCDGAEPGRNYYSDFAKQVPDDALILTLGCGKYRIRDHDYGTFKLNGVEIPRLLDMGQCNDAYGAISVAVALAKAFDCGVNDLPLSIVLSWFEQKAVAVLLTLLALDVKGIRVGPTAPSFFSPKVFQVLQERFDLQLISAKAPEKDLAACLA